MHRTAHVFAPITKTEQLGDGSLLVFGKMTGPDLDVDEQRCDPEWLRTAVPEWFKVGNVREMHQTWAVGKGLELDQVDDDWYLTAKIVDDGAIKKINTGVYTGFSIGIRNPKTRPDPSAPGGLIVGGEIVENSVVDRPANPTATLVLAKAAGTSTVLTPTRAITKNVTTEPEASMSTTENTSEETKSDGTETVLEQVRKTLSKILDGAGDTADPTEVTLVRTMSALAEDTSWLDGKSDSTVDDIVAAIKTAVAPADDVLNETDEITDIITEAIKAALSAKTSGSTPAIAEIAKTATIARTKAAAAEELTKKLAAELAKVKEMAAPGGPNRTAPGQTTENPAKGELLAKAARYERMADTVTQPDLRVGYRQLAEAARSDANKL